MDDEVPHTDYEVQRYFYDSTQPTTAQSSGIDIAAVSGEHSLAELRDFYSPMGSQYARTELKYKPPWISEDLLDYSLRGLEAIKL